MKTQIVFIERYLQRLQDLLFEREDVEGAAFVLCGQSCTASTTKLISHAVIPVDDSEFESRSAYGLTLGSRTLTRVAKLARHEGLSVLFAHSHPRGICHFSEQDDREEGKLLPFLQARIPGRVHGTVVLTESSIVGRLYLPDRMEAHAIVSVGTRLRMWGIDGTLDTSIYDRQVRAFGLDTQKTLSALHVGIVGLGGTGSPLAEQLCRLGVGALSLFDGDVLERSNVNRVYGSRVVDAGRSKVAIAKAHLEAIGLDTELNAVPEHITYERAASLLRDCDVIFGCTDKQLPRAILSQLASAYAIPLFDLGVLIESQGSAIRGVYGRVTSVLPGEACLFCRGRISTEGMRVESLTPDDRLNQIQDGYAPALETPAPAVISFTSAIASAATNELLHKLTGFMGRERVSSEVVWTFDENRIRTNRVAPKEDCICADEGKWGRGDETPFLGLVWPNHTK